MPTSPAACPPPALLLERRRLPAALAAIVLAYATVWAAALAAGGSWTPAGVGLSLVLGSMLATLSAIDLATLRLPDRLTLPLTGMGLVATAGLAGPAAAAQHALAAVCGYALLVAVAHLYRLSRGEDGLGRGDAKLLAACGAWLGLEGLAPVLLAASLGMLALIGTAILCGRRLPPRLRLPLGPALAGAAWTIWILSAPG